MAHVDMNRLSRAVQRPGIDPREWIVLAVVEDVAGDPDDSLYADVRLLPGDDAETVRIGSAYVGDGFGMYWPLQVGDLVVVAYPGGSAGMGPVLLSRVWCGANAQPPADVIAETQGRTSAATGRDLTADAVLRMRELSNARVYLNGGSVTVACEGSTTRVTVTAGERVVLQDGSQPFVRGTDYAEALGHFLDALKVALKAIGTFATAIGPALPVVGPAAAVVLNLALDAFSLSIDAFANARTTYLSTKVFGQ